MSKEIDDIFLIKVRDLIRKHPQGAKEVKAIIDFNILGQPGSQWSVDLKKDFTVKRGYNSQRDTKVTVMEENLINLVEGRDSWLVAFGLGKIKVDGDLEPLLRLKNLFSL